MDVDERIAEMMRAIEVTNMQRDEIMATVCKKRTRPQRMRRSTFTPALTKDDVEGRRHAAARPRVRLRARQPQLRRGDL